MIFCKTRADVDELTMNLQKNKFSAEALHGDLTQNQRTRIIEQFKCRRFDMLIATDVAARGIDINDLTHVINYALPQEVDTYTHRIGRTGRAGKTGVAISIFAPSEGRMFAAIRKATNNALELRSLPDAKAIIAAKKSRFKADLEKHLPITNPAYHQLAGELCRTFDEQSLIAALLDMRFHKELLIENYPPLTRGKRDRQFGSMHGTHRDNTQDNKRPPRRRERTAVSENPAEAAAEPLRSKRQKKYDNLHSREEKKSRPNHREKTQTAEKPRKKLRDWALNLTEGTAELPRYKVKKRR